MQSLLLWGGIIRWFCWTSFSYAAFFPPRLNWLKMSATCRLYYIRKKVIVRLWFFFNSKFSLNRKKKSSFTLKFYLLCFFRNVICLHAFTWGVWHTLMGCGLRKKVYKVTEGPSFSHVAFMKCKLGLHLSNSFEWPLKVQLALVHYTWHVAIDWASNWCLSFNKCRSISTKFSHLCATVNAQHLEMVTALWMLDRQTLTSSCD